MSHAKVFPKEPTRRHVSNDELGSLCPRKVLAIVDEDDRLEARRDFLNRTIKDLQGELGMVTKLQDSKGTATGGNLFKNAEVCYNDGSKESEEQENETLLSRMRTIGVDAILENTSKKTGAHEDQDAVNKIGEKKTRSLKWSEL